MRWFSPGVSNRLCEAGRLRPLSCTSPSDSTTKLGLLLQNSLPGPASRRGARLGCPVLHATPLVKVRRGLPGLAVQSCTPRSWAEATGGRGWGCGGLTWPHLVPAALGGAPAGSSGASAAAGPGGPQGTTSLRPSMLFLSLEMYPKEGLKPKPKLDETLGKHDPLWGLRAHLQQVRGD